MNKIRRIIGKVIRGLSFFWEFVVLKNIYDISYRLNSPKLSALILVLLTNKLNGKKKYRVLCLGRSIFYDDIRALIAFGNNIQYLYFHKILLGKIVRYMIPFSLDPSIIPGYLESDKRENIGSEDGVTYHLDPRYNSGKKRVHEYMSKMFPILHRILKFDAVMSGNYVYVDQQEFLKICEEKHIPGIILNKEGFMSYYVKDGENYGLGQRACKFIGAKMLFVNDHVKRHELKYLNGLVEEKTITVGIPRYDFYIKNPNSHLKQVVLFGFLLSEYIKNWLELKENLEFVNKCNKISEKFYKNIIEFAVNHPDYRVIIKLKGPAPRYKEPLDKVICKHFDGIKIANLEITSRAHTDKLILDSRAVLGYNSAVLLEALLANKTIISPDFGNLKTFDYFHETPNFVFYSNKYAEIEKIILNYKDYESPNIEEKRKLCEGLFFKIDGKSSERTTQAIISTIEEYKKLTV